MRSYSEGAREILKFEGWAGTKIFSQILGDQGVICWMQDFENLAALESATQALMADPGFQKQLKAIGELLLPGGFDKVYSSID